MSYLHHKETVAVPRHLQSHSKMTLRADDSHEYTKASFPGCCMGAAQTKTAAKEVDVGEVNVLDSKSSLEKMTAERESKCEKWIDEYADSINQRHYVTSQFAFDKFAPSKKETLSSIFGKYSGSAK